MRVREQQAGEAERTPGLTQMMSTARSVGMWKCDVHRVPPSKEEVMSSATCVYVQCACHAREDAHGYACMGRPQRGGGRAERHLRGEVALRLAPEEEHAVLLAGVVHVVELPGRPRRLEVGARGKPVDLL